MSQESRLKDGDHLLNSKVKWQSLRGVLLGERPGKLVLCKASLLLVKSFFLDLFFSSFSLICYYFEHS